MNFEKVTLEELIVAYRKIKIDTFYEVGHLTHKDFAIYEEDLVKNLDRLLARINSGEKEWIRTIEFVGTYMVTLKSIESISHRSHDDSETSFYSSFARCWSSISNGNVDFRILGRHSVDFHVLSSLWLDKVGLLFDNTVSKNSYGCRLKGQYKDKRGEAAKLVDAHSFRMGHFRPYFSAYQKWQSDGINSIIKGLNSSKRVVAVTADLRKYYHRIDCSFILDEKYLSSISVTLNDQMRHLTSLICDGILFWSESVYADKLIPSDFKFNGHCGIPMTLGASKLIANLLLSYLDSQIESEIKPLFYGRYVDDILLVLEDGSNIKDSDEFWKYLAKRLRKLKLNRRANNSSSNASGGKEYKPNGHILTIPYSPKSLVEFGRHKEKYFFLEGVSGVMFMDKLKESLDENSSEWNLPPDSESDIEEFSKQITSSTSDEYEAVNGLRKAEGVSLHRLKFILYLKRLEVVVKFFPKEKWEPKLESFYCLFLDYAMRPTNFPVYIKYYTRVASLLIKVGRFDFLEELVRRVKDIFARLVELNPRFKYLLLESEKFVLAILSESVGISFLPSSATESEYEQIRKIGLTKEDGYDNFIKEVKRNLLSDLHSVPLKSLIAENRNELREVNSGPKFDWWSDLTMDVKRLPNYKEFSEFYEQLGVRLNFTTEKDSLPFGLYFYTRPFSLFDLSMIFSDWAEEHNTLVSFKKFCRLYGIDTFGFSDDCCRFDSSSHGLRNICLEAGKGSLNRTVAFTSLETRTESWVASVQGFADSDKSRAERILSLVRSILKTKGVSIDYVVFPELSIPTSLLAYISQLFLLKRISLIAGVEYLEVKNVTPAIPTMAYKQVTNRLWFVLTVRNWSGCGHLVINQEKVTPAQKEESDLYKIGGAVLTPRSTVKYLISHDNFFFAGLICNEFLDISNRAMFRGLVDALVVVEWNMDTETYNALVESAANDMHTSILQVNNRMYGDTRLRIPYKKSFMRDVVRVRGGDLDYFVIATLPVTKLREFQRNHRSPEEPFKPVPTGFRMSDCRRRQK